MSEFLDYLWIELSLDIDLLWHTCRLEVLMDLSRLSSAWKRKLNNVLVGEDDLEKVQSSAVNTLVFYP